METQDNIIKTSPINLGAKGYYSLSVYKADGSEVVEKRIENSGNVVTYDGAYRLFFNDAMFSAMYANIGTGASELTRASVGLGNRFSATSSSSGPMSRIGKEVDNGDGTSTLTFTRFMSFSLGATAGTFSEVGISLVSNGADFIAGQLIKDEFGNPTTITVLADEQLRVTYTLELTVPNGEQGAKLIGTGAVTTPEGSVNYSVYAQPFFRYFAVGDSETGTRQTISGWIYTRSSPTGSVQSFAAGTDSYSHNGSGVVTRTSAGGTASPSSFSNTAIKYHLSGDASSSPSYYTTIDPVTRLTNPGGTIPVLVEYETPISKDSTRSYKCQIEVVYNI